MEPAKKETVKNVKEDRTIQLPFTLYCSDNFQKVKAENPELKMAQVKKILADQWTAADADTKAIYEKKAKDQTECYKDDVEAVFKVLKEQKEKKEAQDESNEVEDSSSSLQ